MVVLITQQLGNGKVLRCDAKCYLAHEKKCHCICGGLNHGKGLKKAMQSIGQLFLPLTAVLEGEHGNKE